MGGMTGEYTSLAQAVGEAPIGSPAFVAGIDFDPGDPDEVEIVKFAGQISRAERLEELRQENAQLRALLSEREEDAEW